MSQIATLKTWDTAFLYPMQQVIKDYLYTDPFFHDFAIITEDMGNLPEELEKALQGVLTSPNGKMGCSIMIHTLRGRGDIPNSPASYSMNAEAIFIIAEHPALNRGAIESGNPAPTGEAHAPVAGFLGVTETVGSGVPGLIVAETLIAVMKKFDSSEFPTRFREPEKPQAAPIIDKDTGLIIHTITMLFHGGVEDVTKVAVKPVIALVGQLLLDQTGHPLLDENGAQLYAEPDETIRNAILTSETEGAVIYYTTDGLTRPTKDSGTLYEGGLLDSLAFDYIWARAYRDGWRASTIAFADIQNLVTEEDEGLLEESGRPLF